MRGVVVGDVVCTFCGSLCDDLEVELEGGSIRGVRRACAVGRAKFLAARDTASPSINGQPASPEAALEEAARLLLRAGYPLIYGLSTIPAEAQKEAIALAELLGANIDSTSSHCHGPSTMARQQTGLPTCSLGEAKNRADLVVFWGSNPAESSPRHFVRYSVGARGLLTPQGRKDRTVVVVDVRPTATARLADEFLQIAPGQDYEALTVLRALVKGVAVEGRHPAGVPVERWARLAELMKKCRYGAVFFGMGLTMSRGREANLELLLTLVKELNAYTRFHALPMRGHGNVAGSENVLAWQTGFPFGVNFSAGYPRFNPGEFTAVDLLARGEVDACLVIGADPAAHLPGTCVRHLASIPVIVIDPHPNLTASLARVTIPVAPAGVAAAGTFYRMDNVPLRAKKLVDLGLPSDEEVLRRLRERIARAEDRQRSHY
ncbi:MAG: formylmethanofuran dehydrogenase subunit B [Clostridia bacterium]|nr:formylmethanofuran dehydrogenase subunit B [Clostridia bacterium]